MNTPQTPGPASTPTFPPSHVGPAPSSPPAPPAALPPPAPTKATTVDDLLSQAEAREFAAAKSNESKREQALREYVSILMHPDTDPAGEKLQRLMKSLGLSAEQVKHDSVALRQMIAGRKKLAGYQHKLKAFQEATAKFEQARYQLSQAENDKNMAAINVENADRVNIAMHELRDSHPHLFVMPARRGEIGDMEFVMVLGE